VSAKPGARTGKHPVPTDAPGILVVQKNNIGDLVLVTPLLGDLRRRFPSARLDVLANSYNAPVLDRNPDVDNVIVHTKRKHDRTVWQWVRAVRQIVQMRATRYDCALLLSGRFSRRYSVVAKLVAPATVAGFRDGGTQRSCRVLDVSIAGDELSQRHVVPRSFHLAWLVFPPPGNTPVSPKSHPCRVFPDPIFCGDVRRELAAQGLRANRPIVALQISARRVRQRWPIHSFAQLAREVRDLLGANPVFFWSPGAAADAMHPGDDDRMDAILALSPGPGVLRYRTARLPQLIAGLSIADVVVSADGGAMHVAAACGRPVVALFGDADSRTWHPWCEDFRVLHAENGDVASIGVRDVLLKVQELLEMTSTRADKLPGIAP
jgi:heptosyltransferase III